VDRARKIPTLDERFAEGRKLRTKASRASHADWHPTRSRRDPVERVIESSRGRVPELLPIRYARMLQSPFAFFRGAASIMAADLHHTSRTDLRVQACGDCHLLNFGMFATPERRRIFDINDFDETLPAPWEWDVKRLAASFVIAGRNNRFSGTDCRAAASACARSYRENMWVHARQTTLEAWYSRIDDVFDSVHDPELRRFYEREWRKATRRDHTAEHANLSHVARGKPRIHDDPPLVYHPSGAHKNRFDGDARRALRRYRESLPEDRRPLFDRYQLGDLAMKVVGVGSVGTWCGVALFLASANDPLYLQIKEARASVLEPFAGKSALDNHGERVVVGQRLMQAASDIFLGWTRGDGGRHFYLRQLRDFKIKPAVELMRPWNLERYAELCGKALARAHARSGDSAVLAGYMGKSKQFESAITRFATDYAKQNESDYDEFVAAARKGRFPVGDAGL